MPRGGRRNGYEQRQGGHRSQVPCPYLAGGFGEKVQLALPRSAISQKGNENYFEAQPRISIVTHKQVKVVLYLYSLYRGVVISKTF